MPAPAAPSNPVTSELVCARSGKALDNGNNATAGSQAIQWTVNGGTPQQWSLVKVG